MRCPCFVQLVPQQGLHPRFHPELLLLQLPPGTLLKVCIYSYLHVIQSVQIARSEFLYFVLDNFFIHFSCVFSLISFNLLLQVVFYSDATCTTVDRTETIPSTCVAVAQYPANNQVAAQWYYG